MQRARDTSHELSNSAQSSNRTQISQTFPRISNRMHLFMPYHSKHLPWPERISVVTANKPCATAKLKYCTLFGKMNDYWIYLNLEHTLEQCKLVANATRAVSQQHMEEETHCTTFDEILRIWCSSLFSVSRRATIGSKCGERTISTNCQKTSAWKIVVVRKPAHQRSQMKPAEVDVPRDTIPATIRSGRRSDCWSPICLLITFCRKKKSLRSNVLTFLEPKEVHNGNKSVNRIKSKSSDWCMKLKNGRKSNNWEW